MYIDSENNSCQGVSNYNDDGFYNHTFMKSNSHIEGHRQDDADEFWEGEFPMTSFDCDYLDQQIALIDNKIYEVSAWTAKERVINRNIASLEMLKARFKDKYVTRSCSQEYIDEQDEDYLKNVSDVFKQESARSDARRGEDYTLLYTAMGVGFMVIASVIIMANK